jgi:protein TonB
MLMACNKNRIAAATAIFNLLMLLSPSASAQEQPPYVSPLPKGSTTHTDDDGRFVRCMPPPEQKIPNFKELYDRFLSDNKRVRVAIPEPRFDKYDWITPADYPRELRGSGKQGIVGIEVSIGASGAITACRVTKSSGSAELDAAACDATLRKAKFLPRLGRDGLPMDSTYSRSIRWLAR